jgi:hypothetical protein
VLKDSPKKLAFYVAYSNAVYAGEIGPGKRTSKAKSEELADKHSVRHPAQYFEQLNKQIAETGRLSRKKRTGDLMILEKDTEESTKMRKALETFAVQEKYKFTYEMAEVYMRVTCGVGRGCSAGSIRRFINNPANSWKRLYEGTVPLFTEKHKSNRMLYAHEHLANGDNRWRGNFEVDEKWFYAYCTGQKCKVPPGHKRPKKPLQSKRHIPKVMYLAATALPRPDKGFDGKIGLFRVCETVTAKRTSKYHQKGDEYEKDVTMTAEKYLKMLTEQVFPAARRKMKSARNLRCQQDGAAAHTGKHNVKNLDMSGASKNKRTKAEITVLTQPAQSPDTNINDLAIFPSMSRRFNKLQKHEKVSDLDRLAANARQTWNDFPADVLTKAWSTKTNVLKAIIKAKGGNDFKLPHAKDVKDLDWEALFEEWEEEKESSSSSEEEESLSDQEDAME